MTDAAALRDLYLDLLARTLTGMVYQDPPLPVPWISEGRQQPYDEVMRTGGSDWPTRGHTMIGLLRLRHLRDCAEQALRDGVPGDFMECGAWRAGACIFLRAVLKAHGVTGRLVWVADSFQGLHRFAPGHESLAVSEAEARGNFAAYGLLDDQVRFVPGWFHESLPGPVGTLAVLRLDGDQYIAQTAALEHLYPRLSPGGYVIIDDYPGIPETREAVDDYRAREGITQEIVLSVPNVGWWRK